MHRHHSIFAMYLDLMKVFLLAFKDAPSSTASAVTIAAVVVLVVVVGTLALNGSTEAATVAVVGRTIKSSDKLLWPEKLANSSKATCLVSSCRRRWPFLFT